MTAPPERPVATVEQLARLIEEMPDRYRLTVVLAGWCGLRRGEVLGLEREDTDFAGMTVTV